MAIDTYTYSPPNAKLGGANELELVIPEFTGIVEGTIQRVRKTEGFVNMRTVRGTATITNHGIGKSTLQKVTKGAALDGTETQHNRVNVTVDTVMCARTIIALIDAFQSSYDVRAEIGNEHGKEIAKFVDNAILIAAAKAGMSTSSAYSTLPGHAGGSQYTFANSADVSDPALLLHGIGQLFKGMSQKDVNPQEEGMGLFLSPAEYYTLAEADQLINGEYTTAEGTSLPMMMLKVHGVPVIMTNNLPSTNITAHPMSNSGNSSFYNGNFTKLKGLVFNARALLAGETIAVTPDVFYDKKDKAWYVDAHLAFAAGINRAEYSGALLLP